MYALIHNNQIQVGPRQWSYSMFKDYLDEELLDSSQLPRAEPTELPIVTSEWSILPVERIEVPSYDSIYQQLAGPFLTINENNITGVYSVVPVPLESIKSTLRSIVTDHRYYGENMGTTFEFNDGDVVSIYTNREDRNIYLQAYQILQDGEQVVFKFPRNVFKSCTKAELGLITQKIAKWVQDAFDWESAKYSEIEACASEEDLKKIQLQNPSWVKEDASKFS